MTNQKPITPDVWGPSLWKSIHYIALAYSMNPTDEQKIIYKNYFTSIQAVLPCSICANNYARHLIELPLTDEVLKNKETLVKWTIDMHNKVNEENGKTIYSFDDGLKIILDDFPTNNVVVNISNEKPSKKNIDFRLKNKPSNKSLDNEDEDTSTIFSSFTFWLIILLVLMTIAVVYKKY